MTEPGAIRLQRTLPQPASTVWRALTDPAIVSKWWAQGDIRPQVGHTFTLDMGPFGQQRCEVKAVEPERLFVYDFGIGMLNTTISWRLDPSDEGTLLSFEHAGFDLDTDMGKQAMGGMSAGWPRILDSLVAAVEELG